MDSDTVLQSTHLTDFATSPPTWFQMPDIELVTSTSTHARNRLYMSRYRLHSALYPVRTQNSIAEATIVEMRNMI